jgi:hypothetical protein
MQTNSKPATDLLREIENGQFVADMTAKINEIVAAVLEVRKNGKLTISLDFKPTGKGTVNIDADISAKVPEHDRPTSTFFVGNDNVTLQRRDPNQPDLPLTVVKNEHEGAPLRQVGE